MVRDAVRLSPNSMRSPGIVHPAWQTAEQVNEQVRASSGKVGGSEVRLVGADDREVLVDEDVVRPVDADVVNLVLGVAQLHNTVNHTSRVGGERSFRRLIRRRSAGD